MSVTWSTSVKGKPIRLASSQKIVHPSTVSPDAPAVPPTGPGHEARLTVAILGAALDNPNLGVAALALSAVKGTLMAFPNARILVLHDSAEPATTVRLADRRVTVESIWLRLGNTFRDRYDTKHLAVARFLKTCLPRRLAGYLVGDNRTLNQVRDIDVVLDVSGGDSFADIYGWNVLRKQAIAKIFMVRMGKPVILLPQTYGPFSEARSRTLARRVISRCAVVATREERGVEELKNLCGDQLPSRVVRCPDMAFLMDPNPDASGREPFTVRQPGNDDVLIGLNISGLLYLSKSSLNLSDGYRQLVEMIADWALSDPKARLLLVPHVVARKPLGDESSQWSECLKLRDVSDTAACKSVLTTLSQRYGQRVGCLGWPYRADQTKYFIGRCDFFIGARMHSCIGAVSQTVPTVTLAYSKKAAGLMKQIGIGDTVIDLRKATPDEALGRIERLYAARHEIRRRLEASVPWIKAEVEGFFTGELRDAVLSVLDRRR